tara:strand:- start:116 stop:355 length:240 start_codon:yes stop_codon:yes gene_type:complete
MGTTPVKKEGCQPAREAKETTMNEGEYDVVPYEKTTYQKRFMGCNRPGLDGRTGSNEEVPRQKSLCSGDEDGIVNRCFL